jgi:transposase
LYAVENGRKWRAPPSDFGNWRIVYTRFNRWSKNGTLELVFEGLQRENVIEIKTNIRFLDGMSVCVHPNGAGALKSGGKQSIGRSKGGSRQKFIWFARPPKTR